MGFFSLVARSLGSALGCTFTAAAHTGIFAHGCEHICTHQQREQHKTPLSLFGTLSHNGCRARYGGTAVLIDTGFIHTRFAGERVRHLGELRGYVCIIIIYSTIIETDRREICIINNIKPQVEKECVCVCMRVLRKKKKKKKKKKATNARAEPHRCRYNSAVTGPLVQ